MLPETGMAVVRDPEDRFERLAFLRALDEGDQRRLFVPITPCADSTRIVANDLLKALGKAPDLVGAGRNGSEMWSRAGCWLEVSGTQDIFISRAHLLTNWLLEQLVGLATRSGARIWLVFQSAALRSAHERFIENWPVADLSFEQFETMWASRTARPKSKARRSKAAGAAHRLPQVPVDDFPTWRASCRALLSAEDFALVDVEFLDAVENAEDRFDEMAVLDEEAMCAYARELIAACDWMPQVLTRIRGAQVAAFHAGYLMKVNLDVLCSTRVSRIGLDDHVIAELDRYASPRFVAAATLMIASGAQLADIAAIDLGDVSDDGRRIQVGGKAVTLPAGAARLVEALVRERLNQRARAEDPLFVYVPGTGKRHGELLRATERGLFDNIKKIERETGLLITSHLVDAGQRDAVAWAKRRGISLMKI